jgi:hypothetical protein
LRKSSASSVILYSATRGRAGSAKNPFAPAWGVSDFYLGRVLTP